MALETRSVEIWKQRGMQVSIREAMVLYYKGGEDTLEDDKRFDGEKVYQGTGERP